PRRPRCRARLPRRQPSHRPRPPPWGRPPPYLRRTRPRLPRPLARVPRRRPRYGARPRPPARPRLRAVGPLRVRPPRVPGLRPRRPSAPLAETTSSRPGARWYETCTSGPRACTLLPQVRVYWPSAAARLSPARGHRLSVSAGRSDGSTSRSATHRPLRTLSTRHLVG